MEYLFIFVLFISFVSYIQTQKFTQESPYLLVRLMDIKLHQWKPSKLVKMERSLDAELKFTDEKKGTACKSIAFEEETSFPKQDGRFLDISIRGICTDDQGKQHPIDKDLITKATIRRKAEVTAAIHAVVFSIGNAQLYERNRNQLNLIIIPVSIGFVTLLFVLTFFLRRMRNAQKRRHIVAELLKKKEASQKKPLPIANIDPHANDKQRLLQTDPTVAGNASDTMGSPKEFTKEKYTSPTRSTIINSGDHSVSNREYQGAAPPPPKPPKENRSPYNNREDEASFQAQRPLKSGRERMPVPYENESRFSPVHSQYQYEPQHAERIAMHEQQPRVVVRSIRDDDNHPTYYQQQREESSKIFVSIPVQIEHSNSHQRYVPPPYHSDPYYPNVSS